VSAHLVRQEIEAIVAGKEINLLGGYLLDAGLVYLIVIRLSSRRREGYELHSCSLGDYGILGPVHVLLNPQLVAPGGGCGRLVCCEGDLLATAEVELARKLLVDVDLHRGESARDRRAGADVELGEEGIGAAGVLELGSEPPLAQFALSSSDPEEAFHKALAESPLAHIHGLIGSELIFCGLPSHELSLKGLIQGKAIRLCRS